MASSNKALRGASILAVVVAAVGFVVGVFLVTPWILMLLAGALFPQWGVSFVQAILGTVALSIIGGFFKGVR